MRQLGQQHARRMFWFFLMTDTLQTLCGSRCQYHLKDTKYQWVDYATTHLVCL